MLAQLIAAILFLCTMSDGSYAKQLGSQPERRAAEIAQANIEAGAHYFVDPALLTALEFKESSFDQGKVSKRGAFGLFQLLPQYWGAEVLNRCMIDPANCLRHQTTVGARTLAFYIHKCRNEGRGLVGYRRGHCGPPGPEAREVLALRRQIVGR